MDAAHWYSFFRSYLAQPEVVGAVAPSSRALARALGAPFAARTRPARLLEVGAGTGAVTRHLVTLLRPDDHLDICEIQPAFGDILERTVLADPAVAGLCATGRINLIRGPVQDIARDQPYDYIVSGLPLTSFSPELVRTILQTIEALISPAGVFSYFEYVALRKLRVAGSPLSGKPQAREVSRILDEHIARHEIGHKLVLMNVPPAYARYWRFGPTPEDKGA